MKLLRFLLVISMFAVGIYLLPQLPTQVPMHWNIHGQIDSYAPKQSAVWLLPVMGLVMFAAFEILPSLDPKKEKYKLFKREWEIMKTAILVFFTYIHFIVLYIAMRPSTEMMPLMFLGLGALFILMGNYMSKIRQNHFVGIRVPWTLADEENWNKTHRFASWCFVSAGILTLAEAYFIWFAPAVIFGSIMLAAFLPIVYSFLVYKHAEEKMKYVFLALAAIILMIISTRLSTGEDDWICQDGQWVTHGQPSTSKPHQPCN